jgi:uncharacterized protein (TIGR03437 family)
MFNYLRVDVDGGMLTVRATGIEGNEIERFILRPQPVITAALLKAGSPASIFGWNLAVKEEVAIGEPLPLLLGGVRVQLDGQDIPLRYVSPGQVNVQVPYDAAEIGTVQLINDNGLAYSPQDFSRIREYSPEA